MSIVKRTPNQDSTIDLMELARLCWKHKWMMICSAVLLGAIFLAYACFAMTPMYQASSMLYIHSSRDAESATTITSGELAAAEKLATTYQIILTSDPVMQDVLNSVQSNMTIDQLKSIVATSSVDGTEVISVTVTHADPASASILADSIVNSAMEIIPEVIPGSSANVVSYSRIPQNISSPNYKSMTMMGALLGLVCSAALIIVRGLMDTRIKDKNDLAAFPYPILGLVPDLASKSGSAYAYRKGAK